MTDVPDDRPFVKAMDEQIEGNSRQERVVFIDFDNEVREAVYASEFAVLQDVRERLEKAGVLKGIVHVSAVVFGLPDGHGPRFSTVEHIPTGKRYVRQNVVRPALWVDAVEWVVTSLEATDRAFRTGKEEDEEDQAP